jgi:cytochrome c-type biogenesis protein
MLIEFWIGFLDFLQVFWFNIFLGILTPLGAICVLPLYPGFIAFLAHVRLRQSINTRKKSKSQFWTVSILALMVCCGILVSLGFVGFIFTTLLRVSLTDAIVVISRIAFLCLAIYSLILISGVQLSQFSIFKNVNSGAVSSYIHKFTEKPYLASFLFGLFFGLIVLPCNPAPIVLFFSRELMSTTGLIGFIAFGIGICIPLFILAVVSGLSNTFMAVLSRHKRLIDILSGIFMLGVSLYYLFFVF